MHTYIHTYIHMQHMYTQWIYPATGYSDDFVAFLEDITGGNSHLVTLAFGIIFPIVHSGLASLRPYAEKVVGAQTCVCVCVRACVRA